MTRHVYARDHPIPGEVWKSTPCGLASVSDQGRMKKIAGTKQNVSLDAQIGPGASAHDFLMADGTFTTRDRANRRNARQ